MDDATLTRRAEVARRLKAARWLAGAIRETDRGKTGWEVAALTPQELAERSPLPENDITASKLGSIERMERRTTPMELAAIAEALRLPRNWFTIDRVAPIPLDFDAVAEAILRLGEDVAGLGATPAEAPNGTSGTPEQADTAPGGHIARLQGRQGTA